MAVEITGKKSTVAPLGVYIIGTFDENGVPNAMNAAWGMQSDDGEITLMLGKHKTTENFEKTGAFTVALGTEDTVEICDYFGVETGAKVNKLEQAGCAWHNSARVNAPIIDAFPVTLECRVRSWSPDTGYLIGEIVATQADERVLTDGKVDLSKLKLIIFDSFFGAYRSVGNVVAKAFNVGLGLKKQ
ncbi:MAG: flavin reductase family protein [Clostridia bacterium]|nr:flavin reductase family protein [Clostridia bacterium]